MATYPRRKFLAHAAAVAPAALLPRSVFALQATTASAGSVGSRRRHRQTHRRAEVCCPRLRHHEVRRRRRRTGQLHRSDRQGHRRLPCRRRRPRRHTRRPLPYWRDQARVRRQPSPRAEGDARFQQRLAGVSNGLHALGRHRADEPLGVHLRVRGGEHRRHRHRDARRPG